MKIKAKFKGSNSLGYENGKNYWFKLTVLDHRIWIHLIDNQGYKPCAYNTLRLFLNNWQVF